MYLHALKYTLLSLLRDKNQVFWCFAFPLLLGTMFSLAFGNLSDSESFSPIPVAIVMEQPKAGSDTRLFDGIRTLFDALDEAGENQLLEITYTTKADARELLAEKEICGIITAHIPEITDSIQTENTLSDAPLTLTISAEMNSESLYQSILRVFVEQFNMEYFAIADIAMSNPASLPDVLKKMTDPTNYILTASLGADTLDESLPYFFSLIAMTCLYAAIAGCNIAINQQANLSALGARRCISPVHKLLSILGDLTAALLFECITVLTSLVYFSCALGIDFGSHIGKIIFASFCGCLCGISLGFFIGCIGRFSRDTKFGLLMAVVMLCCFLSGLMVSNMRILIENTYPFLNRINPAALIADALYAVVIYPSKERFFTNIASLLLLSSILCFSGFVMTRRKKYASI